MLQITLIGLDEEVRDIICNAILLWKKDNKYHFLYANPSLYLNTLGSLSLSNASYSSRVLENDGSRGTEIS